jgi:hypothetical protein
LSGVILWGVEIRWKGRKRQREVDCGIGRERDKFEQHCA